MSDEVGLSERIESLHARIIAIRDSL